MTRISPLADSHKTGLFGDYKNQNESDLLIIREVTNVKIYQVVQYKSSQLDINSITLNGLKFPINI